MDIFVDTICYGKINSSYLSNVPLDVVTRVDSHLHPSPIGAIEQVLCRLDDIGDGASKEVSLPGDHTTLCVVRQGMAVYAYVNSCPHTGAPLNWDGDRFLTRDGDMIQCAVHGALFRLHDGLCIWGPCLKQRLIAVPIVIRDDTILVPGEESSRSAHSRNATK